MKRVLRLYAFHLLLAWVVVLSVLYSTLSIVRHNRFESGGFDLGLYDQAVWQYSRFLWPYNTIKDRFILGDHLALTLPLLAPLYWAWDDVRALLIFQAVWVSASTIAIYKLVKLRKFSSFTALVISFLYSLFYGIQYAVFFDFHPASIGVGLIAWFLYFFESKRKTGAIVAAVLLVLTQENMGLALAALGLIYVFRKEFRKSAVLCIIFGVGTSLLASKIIAFFSPVGFQYWPQIPHNPKDLFLQFFDTLEKRQVWLYSLSWFSYLPVFSPGALLATSWDLAQYFVTGPEFSRMWSPFMHHRIILAPIMTLGTLDVLAWFRNRKGESLAFLSMALLTAALAQQFYFHLPLNKLTKRAFWKQEQWMSDNRNMIATIPPEIKLATAQNLIPHLSHRQYVYLAWPREHDFPPDVCGKVSCWWLDFDQKAQFLFVDLHPNQWLTQILETNQHFREAVENMERSGVIGLERTIGDARLYRVRYP